MPVNTIRKWYAYNHGVPYRAQVLNMLRQLGLDVPELDYIVWARQSTGEAG